MIKMDTACLRFDSMKKKVSMIDFMMYLHGKDSTGKDLPKDQRLGEIIKQTIKQANEEKKS